MRHIGDRHATNGKGLVRFEDVDVGAGERPFGISVAALGEAAYQFHFEVSDINEALLGEFLDFRGPMAFLAKGHVHVHRVGCKQGGDLVRIMRIPSG